MSAWQLLAVVVVALCLPAASRAQAESPYRLDLAVDLPLIGLGTVGTMAALLEVPPPACLPNCSADGINAIDRTVLGNYSETAHTIADVTVLTMIGAPLLLNAIDSRGKGLVEDMTVFGQALLLTQALTQLTKFAVRRTAPFVYDPSTPSEALASADASRAFFSGHAATAFAAASAYTVTYWLRHPNSGTRWVVLGVSAALAVGVSLLKIEAGYHFWTDIAAGAIAGASIGTMVPLLHARD